MSCRINFNGKEFDIGLFTSPDFGGQNVVISKISSSITASCMEILIIKQNWLEENRTVFMRWTWFGVARAKGPGDSLFIVTSITYLLPSNGQTGIIIWLGVHLASQGMWLHCTVSLVVDCIASRYLSTWYHIALLYWLALLRPRMRIKRMY